jgi:hypothetical protein
LFPIVQTVVVESNITGIVNRAEYNALQRLEAEFALLQQIQETNQKNFKVLSYAAGNLMIRFWKYDTMFPKSSGRS